MKRVLITRPRLQAGGFAKALQQAGFEPIFFPVIEIRPIQDTTELDQALRDLDHYDWLIFTSVNGVEVVWARLNTLGIDHIADDTRLAAIGPKTAQALKQRGVEPAFVPDKYVAEAILPGLGNLNGRRVLLPRAEIARKALPEAIAGAGGIAHEIAVYQTLPVQPDPVGMAALQSGVDILTFTSPSTVYNFTAIIQNVGMDPLDLPGRPLIACIGPITAAAAREKGLNVGLVADEYTTNGLVEAIIREFDK
jgi:uroporphyrinogen-III synthase